MIDACVGAQRGHYKEQQLCSLPDFLVSRLWQLKESPRNIGPIKKIVFSLPTITGFRFLHVFAHTATVSSATPVLCLASWFL